MKKSSFKTIAIALSCVVALTLVLSTGCFLSDDDDDPAPAVTDTTAPTVESTVPANLEGDYNGTTITVNFSEEIDASTISVIKSGTACSTSSIQIYSVAFSRCVAFDGDLTSSDNKKFTGTSAALTSYDGTNLKIIVTTDVEDKAGNPLAAQFESSFTE